MSLESGTRLQNRYTIVKCVGFGALGANYLARDGENHDTDCTIREIGQAMSAEERLSAKAALEREARFLAPLDHPSLRTRLDYFEQDDCLFVVRDWVDGVELKAELSRRGGTVDELTATRWLSRICDVLHYLHTRTPPIVYRWLCPENVVYVPDSDRLVLNQIDFPSADGQYTAVFQQAGYVSPEQYAKQLDPRSDIFAAGALLFHLVTGLDPDDNPLLTFDFTKYSSPRQLDPTLSVGIESIIRRAVAFKLEDRYDSVLGMARELQENERARHSPPDAALAADVWVPSPEDRHEYGPQLVTREVSESDWRGKTWHAQIELDLKGQILALSVPEDMSYSSGRSTSEAPLAPTLVGVARNDFVSASALAAKAKQFDDGLYAAVELAAQNGAGAFAGKAFLLKGLLRSLFERGASAPGNAAEILAAAAALAGPPVEVPGHLEARASERLAQFLADELRSKPISFYTWSEPLRAIFRQDRMLQTRLDGRGSIEALGDALRGDPRLRATYEGYLELTSNLTNPAPPEYSDLRPLLATLDSGTLGGPESAYFFPPSVAHETELAKSLFRDQPIPEGFSLADEMIKRIRARDLDLTPTEASGWYDYQTWALEPFVVPERMAEAARLNLDAKYRAHLLESFKAILALTRETHIKQLEVPMVGAAMPPIEIVIRPELSAEPLPTYYFRRALSYRFVRRALETTFGAKALQTMHRQTATGASERNLDEELRNIESLFSGAYVTVRRQLGLTHPADAADEEAVRHGTHFLDWAGRLAEDEDLGRDPRMMVPLFYDVGRNKTKVWAVLGWASRPVRIDFEVPPQARLVRVSNPELEATRILFKGTERSLAYLVSAEVYVENLLDRDEFRRHCDTYGTRSAILANLR